MLIPELALSILMPITNKKIKRFIPYVILMSRIDRFNILKDRDETYKKLMLKEPLNESELNFLNENII
ncbi:MAG: hypothetical protein E6682_02775 [Clostridium perfringens]|uniref:Uncharacterized protein n=1 Tax=Clostridium perfringens TaxID=1502 RepID=A0ABD4PUQ7_CLOPF|nr:hypothetical protein [Clostridium perfringens]EGT3618131.1 hypothetical protein [Clostridium perfringens]EGT4141133.1 hypothetical protein [Clostridium perfringens]MBO3397986.1 hypothetical protein [Clostridium perfringens]MBO3408669.1 hypothetical protein [Clostridium perfringens]MBO3416887.1 hypothetical protein [Clostridium perfringens]